MSGVRIPQVGERIITPQQGVQGGHLDAPGVNPTGRALVGVGAALGQAADAYRQRKAYEKAEAQRQAEEDAKAYAAKAVPQMSLDLSKIETDARATAQPGAVGYTDTVGKQVDDYLKKARDAAPTEASKKYIEEHGASLRAGLLAKAYDYEVGERQANRVDQFQQGNAIAANAIGADPSQYEAMLAQQRHLIDTLDARPEVKRQLHEANLNNLSSAAVLSEASRDPAAAEAKLRLRLGQQAGSVPMDRETLYQAVEHRESRGNQAAVSPVGARGVMQLMPATARELEKKYGFPAGSSDRDPRVNRELGRRYLDEQLQRFGDVRTALVAYNWGPERAAKWEAAGGDVAKLPEETRKYIDAIAPGAGSVSPGESVGGPYDRLDTKQAITLLGQVQAERARQDTGYRTYVSGRVQDDNAAALDGKPSATPLTADDFVRAYGDAGPAAYAEYHARQATGAKIPQLAAQTGEQIALTVKAAEPQTGEGYAAGRENYVALTRAANQVITERNADPVAFAVQHNLGGVAPLRLGQPDAPDQLRRRQANAAAMTQKYGVPYRLLSTEETTQLSVALGQSTPAEQVRILQQFRTSLDDNGYRSVVAQLAPEQPLTASAAAYLGAGDRTTLTSAGRISGAKVADRVLAGQALLAPPKGGTKVDIGADKFLRDDFNTRVGGAYRGQPAAQERAFGAYRAYYAATAAQRGTLAGETINDDIADEAFNAVTGGVAEINNQQVVLPWGMGADRFEQLAQDYWPRALTLAGLPDSTSFAHATFAPAGGDRYYVMAGDTPLQKADGQGPVVMQINLPSAPVPVTGMSSLAESYGAAGF